MILKLWERNGRGFDDTNEKGEEGYVCMRMLSVPR